MNQKDNYNDAEQKNLAEFHTTIEPSQEAEKAPSFTEKIIDETFPGILAMPSGLNSISQELSSQTLLKPSIGDSIGIFEDTEDNIFSWRKAPKDTHWSIPWSDLMMTMFILFAIMYVYHTAIREIPSKDINVAEAAPKMLLPGDIQEDFSRISESNKILETYYISKQMLKTKGLSSFASVDLIPDKAVRIILTGDLLFDSGKAELKPESEESLKEIAHIIRETPYMVNLVGHTDDIPINTEQFPSNWELSTTRASRVARFLIDKTNIPAGKFYITGHASFQPVKPNIGRQNRSVNRRVEIIITKEKPYAPRGSLKDGVAHS